MAKRFFEKNKETIIIIILVMIAILLFNKGVGRGSLTESYSHNKELTWNDKKIIVHSTHPFDGYLSAESTSTKAYSELRADAENNELRIKVNSYNNGASSTFRVPNGLCIELPVELESFKTLTLKGSIELHTEVVHIYFNTYWSCINIYSGENKIISKCSVPIRTGDLNRAVYNEDLTITNLKIINKEGYVYVIDGLEKQLGVINNEAGLISGKISLCFDGGLRIAYLDSYISTVQAKFSDMIIEPTGVVSDDPDDCGIIPISDCQDYYQSIWKPYPDCEWSCLPPETSYACKYNGECKKEVSTPNDCSMFYKEEKIIITGECFNNHCRYEAPLSNDDCTKTQLFIQEYHWHIIITIILLSLFFVWRRRRR